MSAETEPSVLTALDNLNEKVDIIYKHQSLLADYSTTPRDYGTGYLMTEVEAHTLGFILEQEGITTTQLALNTNRTKGGVSKLISKLEDKGLVRRVNEPNNRRIYRLYPTAEGRRACEIHRDRQCRRCHEYCGANFDSPVCCDGQQCQFDMRGNPVRVRFR